MKKLTILLFLSTCLIFISPVHSQTDGSTTELSVQEQLDQALDSLSSLKQILQSKRAKRPIARKIKLITRQIIRAVNSIPPDKCLQTLTKAMDDFYGLVSELGSGIACGPPILPPFLPEGDTSTDLGVNCILPEPNEPVSRLQIGGPFGGAFADVNPVYNQCRDVFRTDIDGNNIPDVCEG